MGILEFLRLRMDPNRLRPYLQMASQRIDLMISKKSNSVKMGKREIAKLLAEAPPREEEARIRVEHIIHEENEIEALEIIKLNCQLCAQRLKQIQSNPYCPPDLLEPVYTLLWASDTAGVQELKGVRKQLVIKYGEKMLMKARCNDSHCVNERAVRKLTTIPPPASVIQQYLELIAEDQGVPWKPKKPKPPPRKEKMDCGTPPPSLETIPGSQDHTNDVENLEKRIEALETKVSEDQPKQTDIVMGEVILEPPPSYQYHDKPLPPPPYPGTTVQAQYIPQAPVSTADEGSTNRLSSVTYVDPHSPLAPILEDGEHTSASTTVDNKDEEEKSGAESSLMERLNALKYGH